MINDALRQQAFHDGTSARVAVPDRATVAELTQPASRASAWAGEADRLELVLEAAEVDTLVAEAARWAERITLCVTAPHSQHGSSPLWGELLARGTKCDRIMVRRPEQAEGWLLHRLHDTGTLLLVEGGGKQVASNLLMMARGDELRVVLSHIPLERALSGAAFGTLLCFRGAPEVAIARACQTQAESWALHARIPSGREIDALTLDPRRREPLPDFAPGPLRPLLEPAELAAGVERLQAELAASSAGDVLGVRAFPGGYRLALERGDRVRAPLVLSLHAGAGWAAGNALLLQAADGKLVLGWRGGLLGHGPPRAELLWEQARLPRCTVDDGAFGAVGLVAHTAAPLAPQLGAFAAEVWRIGRMFGVEPPPALGHVLSDFATLSSRQQLLLLWRALIGMGALELGVATATAVDVLRDQGYLRGPRPEAGGALFEAMAALLVEAAEAGRSFDRPAPGLLRAIQPEASAYEPDDWLECLLRALPENAVVARRTALRLAFEHARERRGLGEPRLCADDGVARSLENAVSSALRRGLLVRVGATGLCRLTCKTQLEALPRAESLPMEIGAGGLLAGWQRALGRLGPLGRALLTRRAGWYGRREALDSVAQRLGLAPERARQIEAEAWREVEADAAWVQSLRARLGRAFAGTRAVDVSTLVADDAFWCGVEQHLGLAEALFEALLGGDVFRVELGFGPRRRAFFARFTQADLDRTLSELGSEAAALELPCPLARHVAACMAASERLDAGLCEFLRDELEQWLVPDPSDPSRVLRFVAAPAAGLEQFPGEPPQPASEALLRLEDVLRSIFRTAGTPLALDAVVERLSKRLDDVPREALVERLTRAPFVRRNPDQYGVLARDVPGGPEAIAGALNEVTEALVGAPRALEPDAVLERVRARVGQTWSPDLVWSVIEGDPALYLSPDQTVTLRRWEHARRLDVGERVCPSIPANARPRFDKLREAPARPVGELLRRLRDELRRLERVGDLDDFACVPLARQLVDLHERLLGEASTLPGAQELAAASASFFLDAIAPDEEAEEGATLDRERLFEARAVLAAVLRWLGLNWLGERG